MTVKPPIKKKSTPPKIVVTIDVDGFLTPALELAVDLALEHRTALHGLFIEDLDLVRAAGLPFTREVSPTSGRPRALDNQRLLRTLNASSRQFRQSLEQHAERFSLSWSYSRYRGRKRSMEFGESAEAEFLIIGHPADLRARTPESKTILLLGNHSQRLYQALNAIMTKLPGQSVKVFLVPARDETAQKPPPKLARQLLVHPDCKLVQINRNELINKIETRSRGFDFVIVERDDPMLLQHIMPSATCPVIVVS